MNWDGQEEEAHRGLSEYTVARGVVLSDPVEVGAARDFADADLFRLVEHTLNGVLRDLYVREVDVGEVVFALRHTESNDMSVLDVEAHVVKGRG